MQPWGKKEAGVGGECWHLREKNRHGPDNTRACPPIAEGVEHKTNDRACPVDQNPPTHCWEPLEKAQRLRIQSLFVVVTFIFLSYMSCLCSPRQAKLLVALLLIPKCWVYGSVSSALASLTYFEVI